MEIKATLQKPCSNIDRLNFIVEQNHNKGYKIEETEERFEAWGYTEEEIAEQNKQAQINIIIAQLREIDLKTVRSLRAIQSGQGTQADSDKLEELEQQAEELRTQLQSLNN